MSETRIALWEGVAVAGDHLDRLRKAGSLLELAHYRIKPMRMEREQDKNFTSRIVGKAIRAIENQTQRVRENRNPDIAAQEQQFFALLDRLADKILAGITERVEKNDHIFYLTELPSFRAQCDRIFGNKFGDFPSELVNSWLCSRDLKHVLHCDGNTLVW